MAPRSPNDETGRTAFTKHQEGAVLKSFILAIWSAIFLLMCGCGYEADEDFFTPPPTCDASNCQGCCLGATCMAGTLDTMCGKAGSACVKCGVDEVCTPTSQPICTSKLTETSLWQVQPSAAEIVPIDPADGLSWDADGSPPDVMVRMTCPTDGASLQVETSEVESQTPSWTTGGCISTLGALTKKEFIVQIIDVDFTVDDSISAFKYTLTQADFQAGSVKLKLPEATGTLTLSLTPRREFVTR